MTGTFRPTTASDTVNPDPIFIVGCPRSGTTLLQVILSRHPRLIVPPELKLFHRYHRASRSLRRQTLDRLRRDLGIPLQEVWADRSASTRDLYQHLHRQLAYDAPDGESFETRLVDKTPEHALRMRYLLDVYPSATVIVLVRDPRDVVASLTKVPWLRCDKAAGASLWRTTYRSVAQAEESAGRPFLWLRYEDLVQDPAGAILTILNTILPSNQHAPHDVQSLLAPRSHDEAVIPKNEWSWKWRALRPIAKGRQGSWHHWPAAHLQKVESACGDLMRQFGYQIALPQHASWPSPASLLSHIRLGLSIPWYLWREELRYRTFWARWQPMQPNSQRDFTSNLTHSRRGLQCMGNARNWAT